MSAYREIGDRICVLHYPPGTVLREADLAEEFGMSRTPMREILQRLRYEGLLESRKRIGTVVKGLSPEAVRDVYEVRIKVVEWAGDVARPFLPSDIADMRSILDQSLGLGSGRDVEAIWLHNNKVHEIQVRVIENMTLKGLYDLLYYQTNRHWFHALPDMWEENVSAMRAQIEQEIMSMENGDTRGAFLVRRNYIITYYNRALRRQGDVAIGQGRRMAPLSPTIDFSRIAFKLH
jgi:DNA-binding GntR family transcriptional regulator